MALVHSLRPAVAEPPDEPDRVNVVRLVEFLGPVSPELALVDPELAARARALLPEAPWVWQPRRDRDEPLGFRLTARSAARRFPWKPAPVLALATVAGVFFGLGWSMADATSTDERALQTRPTVSAPAEPGSLPQSPSAPATPPSSKRPVTAPRFVWHADPRAGGYRFALFRGGRLILERDVTEPAFTLPSSWTFKGRSESLKQGTYRWVVWPYYGTVKLLGPAIASAQYTG